MASYTVLYTATGQPWQVPLSEVDRFLAQGYRRNLVVVGQPAIEVALETSEALVRINFDSAAKLAKLPNVGTATAREVVKNRPYGAIEDLIERVPFPKEGMSWTGLASLISFEVEDNAAE